MLNDARFDDAIGRYVYLTLDGVEHRVYFEESGTGDVGLLLQHTAGADGRQWRHLLEDAGLQEHFRMVAYDLPYHGKSVPPLGRSWWTEEYRLTRDFLMAVPVALAQALGLERPVYMGSSIGGHLAIDLALRHPREFRAVVGLEASAYTPGGFVDEFNHPRIGNDFKAHLMYGMMAPTSPEAMRRETAWVYSQGAPAVFKGDLYYYSVDHDVRNTAATIDTDVCSVDILNGEYDWSGTPEAGEELAAMIPGARYKTMKGLGHFPMSEDPKRFLAEIRPVLERIRTNPSSRLV
ncbi:MAG: alpha/beta hydrolase [Gammaproteobacteria bacterium]|nr:alpha/beta hydrolase [Gammaproteobacteria bacterium]